MKEIRGVVAVILVAAFGTVQASPVQFLFTDGTKLFRADAAGTVGTTVTLSAAIQSLTRLPQGVVLAGASAGDIIASAVDATSGRWNMYRLDDPFGAANLVKIGSLNQGIGSLVFANGEMYGVQDSLNPLRIYKFDTLTGNSTGFTNTGIAAVGGGGLAFDSAHNLFYITDATNNRLYKWAPSGTATLVGPLGVDIVNNGLEFHDGMLYGAVRTTSPGTTMRVGTFDISTGAFTTLVTVSGVVGNGTGFVAVPEPGPVLIFVLGVSNIVFRRRRS